MSESDVRRSLKRLEQDRRWGKQGGNSESGITGYDNGGGAHMAIASPWEEERRERERERDSE